MARTSVQLRPRRRSWNSAPESLGRPSCRMPQQLSYGFGRAPNIAFVLDQGPALGVVGDHAMPHASGALDDRVVLARVGGIAEHHHEVLAAGVDRPVYPIRRDVADDLRPDLD